MLCVAILNPSFSWILDLFVQDIYDSFVAIHTDALSGCNLFGSLEHIDDTGDTVFAADDGRMGETGASIHHNAFEESEDRRPAWRC